MNEETYIQFNLSLFALMIIYTYKLFSILYLRNKNNGKT